MGFFRYYLPFRKSTKSSLQQDFSAKKISRLFGGIFFHKKEIEKRRKI